MVCGSRLATFHDFTSPKLVEIMASFKHYKVANNEQTPILGEPAPQSTVPFVQRMEDDMNITIISLNDEEIEFDLTGVDAAVANALRRILLAEVCNSFRCAFFFT
jgi:hypothetical protein